MCPNCKGTGRQEFHRAFHSFMGTCNFCNGEGTREAFERIFVAKMKEGQPCSCADHQGEVVGNVHETE